GYGAIGSQLSVLAEGMGLDVYFYDVVAKLPIGNAKKVSTLHEMLSFVDIVSLHVPDIPETHLIMGEGEFAVMKKGAMIINAARGSLVDIPCLVQALKSGSLGGAAIDVFPTEPLSSEDDFVSPLQGIDNVILTPHIGGSTIEAQFNIGLEVASKLAAYCDSNANITPINHATLSWAEQICRHQILPLLQDIGTEALN
ncbi:D-3-phosphoglycerate dehydrogenase, partial [Pseudomonas amygdali pv. mori str. 301020]